MAEWLRHLTCKPKVRTAIGSNPVVLGSVIAVRNSSPGQPESCEGNLVAAAGSCSGLMVKHLWPLLEISLLDFLQASHVKYNTCLPTYFAFAFSSFKLSKLCSKSSTSSLLLILSSVLTYSPVFEVIFPVSWPSFVHGETTLCYQMLGRPSRNFDPISRKANQRTFGVTHETL